MIIVANALAEFGGAVFGRSFFEAGEFASSLLVLAMFACLCLGLYVRLRRRYLVPSIQTDVTRFTKLLGAALLGLMVVVLIGSGGTVQFSIGDRYTAELPTTWSDSELTERSVDAIDVFEASRELHGAVEVISKLDVSARTVAEVAEYQLSVVRGFEGVTNVVAGDVSVITVNNRMKASRIVEATLNGGNYKMQLIAIDFGDEWVEFAFSCPVSRFHESVSEFEFIVDSLKRK